MGFKLTFKDSLSTISHPQAYARIAVVNFRYDNDPHAVVVHLGLWANKTAAKDGGTQETTQTFNIPLRELGPHWRAADKHDPRGAVYRWLKKNEPTLKKAVRA